MKLYLGGYYNFYIPNQGRWMDVRIKQPALLSVILTRLGIPPAEVSLIVVNGQLVELDQAVVSEQDEVRLYPAISGGLN